MDKITKFRAWSLMGDIKMQYIQELSYEKHSDGIVRVHFRGSHELIEKQKGDSYVHSGFGAINCSEQPGYWALMQFTNLYDKENQEIWESDIVEYNKKLYEIRYFKEYGCYGMYDRNKKRPLGRSGSSTKYEPYFMSAYHTKKMKKVGNKWENPELLN